MVNFWRQFVESIVRIFRPSPRPPLAKPFPVYVASSVEEWTSRNPPGWAAKYCPADGRYDLGGQVFPAHAQFNADAWPNRCKKPGLHALEDVLSAARAQSRFRPAHRLIEDFILHEVAGHHFEKVGSNEDSTNTLMNARNGPKTEADREKLRQVLRANIDSFDVHIGLPPENPNFIPLS